MNEISYMYLYVSSDFIEYIFEIQGFYKLINYSTEIG